MEFVLIFKTQAVNALEGRIFNGNVIEARFFDAGKFDRRELD